MLGAFWANVRVYAVAGSTDMRKSFDTLAAIVRNHLGQDPLSGDIFVFCNRRRDRLKLLVWDGTGLWISAKRLEKGTFAWPSPTAQSHAMTAEELSLLVSGIDLERTRRRAWYERRHVDAQEKEIAVKDLARTMCSR